MIPEHCKQPLQEPFIAEATRFDTVFFGHYYSKNFFNKDLVFMSLYDITVPLSSKTPTYPGDPSIDIRHWRTLANGDSANVSLLYVGAHSATHVDAPSHFIAGAGRVDSMPLEVLIGEAQVVEVPVESRVIDEQFVLANVPAETTRILFKTRNSEFWDKELREFQTEYTYLDAKAARKLVELGIKLVGIDYLSIEQFHTPNHETHLALLSRNVVILEGLNLTRISPGRYELICLPLKIADGSGDGAPARAVLRQI